ncbi:hypothetical protein CEUSTIGMA_g641.t1 [Chlamydomonas eustigma]|uniref:Rho-GAP domain-containing protein n=1 Tax=Chlamydomonas eustigma TaxID=1157962 RepID=A0A250WQU0_9CHLO|nr:hypothetical protein CEUSTIGMA_g641.t1 [Chlamydomonas eustigma]|eukprot:GAX73188.1 hypothetical protein CEUSTIGMA_g641.t1 [Chlamydomonas eustigma]
MISRSQAPLKGLRHKVRKVGSFNVNGKKPPEDLSLKEWFGSKLSSSSPRPGVVVLGFQEVVPLSASNVFVGKHQCLSASNVFVGSAQTNIMAWDKAIAAELNGGAWADMQYGAQRERRAGQSVATNNEAAGVITDNMESQWSGSLLPLGQHVSQRAGPDPSSSIKGIDALTGDGNEGLYFQVACKQLVGLYLTVWVQKSLLPQVKGVQTAVVTTGFGGYLGNKGAVCARLYIYDTPICFVNAHLSSGDKDGDEAKRNADALDVLQRCDFYTASQYEQTMNSAAAMKMVAALGHGHWGGKKSIQDHEEAIWLGDLNYRIKMPDDEVRRLVRSGQVKQLLEYDQLNRERAANRVFKGWKEGDITFLPTFKFKVGSHTYLGDREKTEASTASALQSEEGAEEDGEAGEVQKRRTPAWCDRILFRSSSTHHQHLTQLSYSRGELVISDHKPVMSMFSLKAKQYKRRKINELLDDAARKAEILQASMRPRPSLAPNVVNIGTVQYGEEKEFEVSLSNSGPVDGVFHFIPPPRSYEDTAESSSGLPAWVTANPSEGIVPAGGSCVIKLVVCVEGGPSGSAQDLAQAANDFLDSILILRVEDGSDLFLSLTGTYTRSNWLGLPLHVIAGGLEPDTQVPLPVARLIQALSKKVDDTLAPPDLFLNSVKVVLSKSEPVSGDAFTNLPSGLSRSTQRGLLQALRPLIASLEVGVCLPEDAPAHDLASLLMLFLGELPQPLLPAPAVALISAAIEAGQVPVPHAIPELFMGDMLNPIELNTLEAILALMRKVVCTYTDSSTVLSHDLSQLMASYLLPPLSLFAPPEAQVCRVDIVQLLIE